MIITVALEERSYDVIVEPGALDRAGAMIVALTKGVVPIVTDAHVAPLHLAALVASLEKAGLSPKPIVLAPGEATKSFSELEALSNTLLAAGVDRGSLIVALGGGVVGDLTGFVAGIIKRGIGFVQIPTTLLAQVDSSVGGKTAINTAHGKNLIGLFHQPRFVLADTDLLRTLPRRELLAGYAEVVKYGALGDRKFFEWLEGHGAQALSGDSAAMVQAVAHSCRMKAAIVARDEREIADRALLNLGHTFGHALEAATGYSDRLLHGEAVAIGMALAFQLSVRLGLCERQDCERFIRHLKTIGLPSAIADVPGPRPSALSLLDHMRHDKKVAEGKLTFVLLRAIGEAFTTTDVPQQALEALLDV